MSLPILSGNDILHDKLIEVAANGYTDWQKPGSFLWFRTASAVFDYRLDGQQQNTGVSGFQVQRPKGFQKIRFLNRSTTRTLYVHAFVGNAPGINIEDPGLPSVIAVPWDVNLAADTSQDFPGFAGAGAPYSTFGVTKGSRRESMLITLKDDSTLRVRVTDTTTTKPVAIITGTSQGAGFIKNNDSNLSILNKSAGAISNVAAYPATIDIAVCEFFYA